MNMSPRDKLIHDMMVLLCDVAQRMHNAADFHEFVKKSDAIEISNQVSALSERWHDVVLSEDTEKVFSS